jgi:hypothetical protein
VQELPEPEKEAMMISIQTNTLSEIVELLVLMEHLAKTHKESFHEMTFIETCFATGVESPRAYQVSY